MSFRSAMSTVGRGIGSAADALGKALYAQETLALDELARQLYVMGAPKKLDPRTDADRALLRAIYRYAAEQGE